MAELPAKRWLQIGRHRVAYTVEGVGAPVLCFELPLNPFARYSLLQARLARTHRAIVVDLRPVIGASNRKPPADDLLDFLSTFCLQVAAELAGGPFAAVGSFMAGPLVLDMALKAKDQVTRIVLLGSLGPISLPVRWQPRSVARILRLPGFPVIYRFPPVRWYFEWFDRRILGPMRMPGIFYDPSKVSTKLEDLYEMHSRPPNIDARYATIWAIRNVRFDRVMSRLREVTCPTLILHGEEDLWVPRRYADELNEKLANSRLVMVPKTRHAPEIEAPDFVADEIRRFLTDSIADNRAVEASVHPKPTPPR